LRKYTGSLNFWSHERSTTMDIAVRIEAEYEDYVDACAQANVPALDFLDWKKASAEAAPTLPAPVDAEGEDEIPF
jgi:hypothetical protein